MELFAWGGVEATSGDFNGDGRADLAIGHGAGIEILLNQGGLSFEPSRIAAYDLSDITTRDMNHDGKLDLIVASNNGYYLSIVPWSVPGIVYVLMGNGNGTFQGQVGYETVPGTSSVVTGDFNGDGRLDVAAGNRSVTRDYDLGNMLWDSISIFPGDGAGRLLAPTTLVMESVTAQYAGQSTPGDRVLVDPPSAQYQRSEQGRPRRPHWLAGGHPPQSPRSTQPSACGVRRRRPDRVRLRPGDRDPVARPGRRSRQPLGDIQVDG